MNFIQNYFQKRTNNMIAQQDYELAEQLMNADLSFQHDKERKYSVIQYAKAQSKCSCVNWRSKSGGYYYAEKM